MKPGNLLMCALLMVAVSCNKTRTPDGDTNIKNDEPSTPVRVPNERPELSVMLLDGRNIDLRILEEDFMLVLFNPTCDHCHDQAKQIKNRIDAFKDYNIYFVSSESIEITRQFSKQLELENLKNVYFGNATGEKVFDQFGPISTPSTYIYKKDGSMVESFDGLVDVEVMIKYL